VPGGRWTGRILAGVDLRAELRAIRGLENLPGLVAALGHEPLWERLPDPRPPAGRAEPVVVGRNGELPWLAVEAADPQKAARALARRLVGRGRLAVVLSIDPQSRRLAVAVALDGVPSLSLAAADPEPVALRCLARLAGSGERPLVFAVRAAEALRGESVGRRATPWPARSRGRAPG
jgi:hypothetical protein